MNKILTLMHLIFSSEQYLFHLFLKMFSSFYDLLFTYPALLRQSN